MNTKQLPIDRAVLRQKTEEVLRGFIEELQTAINEAMNSGELTMDDDEFVDPFEIQLKIDDFLEFYITTRL